MKRRQSLAVGFFGALALSALTLGACKQEIPLPELSTRSDAQVHLPSRPVLVQRPYKVHHDDGALTVEGIVRHRDEFLGKDVQVRGVIKRLVRCPEPPQVEMADAGEAGDSDTWAPPPRPPRTCDPPPHAYLVDKAAVSDRELLVYGTMWSPLADFELGQEVTLDGRFEIVSKDGVFLRQAGLIQLADLPPPEPPAADEEDGGPTP